MTTENVKVILDGTKISNSAWHRAGQPNWWARIGQGDSARFLEIGRIRGDKDLSVEVTVPAGSTIAYGVGPATGGRRYTVTA